MVGRREEGYPIPDLGRGCPGQVWMVGGGVPHPRSGVGGYPSQVWMVGLPHPRSGVGGVPWPGVDGGGYPIPVVGGTPARSGWWGGTQGTPTHPLDRAA